MSANTELVHDLLDKTLTILEKAVAEREKDNPDFKFITDVCLAAVSGLTTAFIAHLQAEKET